MSGIPEKAVELALTFARRNLSYKRVPLDNGRLVKVAALSEDFIHGVLTAAAPEMVSVWRVLSDVVDTDTAPWDGKDVLLGYFPDTGGESQEVAFWHSTKRLWCGRVLLNAEGHFSPTNWQPLPLPPTGGGDRG